MLDMLVLRLDAPLVSFGGTLVDNRGFTQDFPGLSLLTGLLGNALGYEHREAEALGRLQRRLRYAVRRDRRGALLRDYQTVDLGQDFLSQDGWTTRGRTEGRAGGDASIGTHIRFRDYHADSLHTIVLTLTPASEPPDLESLERALREPERPLFIGRKCCLPAGPLLVGRLQAPTLREGLELAAPLPPERRGEDGLLVEAWWPAEESGGQDSRALDVTDERDWHNQIHTGRRTLRHGRLRAPEGSHAE
jgi:CRISPR system Cascade subunit CasD